MLQARYPVVLASASPRRKELLSRLFADFEVVVPEVNEELLRCDDPWQTARATAVAKASWVFERMPNALVIAGDTVVAIHADGGQKWQQLGKPKHAAEAVEMLESLSGRSHAVVSAIALKWPGQEAQFEDTSSVNFREIIRTEIVDYVATREPMDKAGAYAIQGGAKGFVNGVEGNLSTVIGLPIERLESELLANGLALTSSNVTT